MSTARIHHHPSLPAPVIHAGFSVHQSKSHVLAGVQDAYWSDDDAEDADCPLCLEELDIADLNFKPCVCGYQICRFCWHHIKQNLNGRCPACRREYTDEAVQFKAIAKEDHKRLTQQKKQREKERKELDALGRRQLANVRVVQRNVVYVVGIGPRFAKEELIPTLRSSEYFGQYGKISKILLVKRTSSGGGAPVVGIYITYHRREDAARCISAVDGTPSPGGGREVMRASYGTTKYCMAFLRGASCPDHGCMNLHEWGDEKDCFTKEDLTTLKHTIKDTESRRAAAIKKGDESDRLPRGAAWGSKASSPAPHPSATTNHGGGITTTQRPPRRGGTRQVRNTTTATIENRTASRPQHERKAGSVTGSNKTPSVTSSSRPPTPAAALLPQRPVTPPEVKALRPKESQPPQPSISPAPSIAVESDLGSGSQDISPSPARPQSPETFQSNIPSAPSTNPDVPPGLSGPPGLPPPSRNQKVDLLSPQSIQPSYSSYQMSTAAQALLDDVKARRENVPAATTLSPFPDFDRTLHTLRGDDGEFGGFSFNLDPKLAGDNVNPDAPLPELEMEANMPFTGNFMDAFPALRTPVSPQQRTFVPPPGLSYPHNPNRSIYDPLSMRSTPVERQSTGGSNYLGSFNPFAEAGDDGAASTARKASPFPDEERKVSRFGFARGRQGSTAASSPIHVSSPLSASDSHHSFFNSTVDVPSSSNQSQWTITGHPEYGYSQSNSPLVQPAQAIQSPQQQVGRFQPFDTSISVSEAQLRDLIQSSRDRATSVTNNGPPDQSQYQYTQHQQFNDPAIMSARFASPVLSPAVPNFASNQHNAASHQSPSFAYGPPPGLSYPPGIPVRTATPSDIAMSMDKARMNATASIPSSTSPSPSPALSSSDFPALNAETPVQLDATSPADDIPLVETDKEQAKAERKAAKKKAAAERALERQKIAQEKAAAKAAEKAKLALEKAAEKEKAAALKEEKDKALKAKLEQEKAEKERAEKEKLALEKAQREKAAAKEEKEKAAQAEKEKIAQAKAQKAAKQAATQNRAKTPVSTPQKSIPTPNQTPAPKTPQLAVQAPILSKMPKKNKPVTRPIRIPKEEEAVPEESSALPSASASDVATFPSIRAGLAIGSSSNNSRAQSMDRLSPIEPTSIADLLDDIDVRNPGMDLPSHPFFDMQKINPAAKMPLEYGPLVHALSALSVGGGSFATNMPSGSIDNAVSSFQQLLETLTQTISDLLRLLPRTTWDDSSSFDGVLRDMLKGDDFLDDGGDEASGKEDEVAALTLALERRARWMEVQLSKLEELHRDINTAAVRAVLAFNDAGWDRHLFMPRVGNTLRRFDTIGTVERDGKMIPMTADELEKKLEVASEAAVFAETQFREAMEKMQTVRPVDMDEY
ncbi:hypothetical protein BJ138DRAFT_1008399 [Hygrophoropsis aurantiaca]|uniref:Uncharacterized protein n=1 Tax=Hygrophoropsis aurantiaca TaxID=72124 RepID=A0ACB8ABP2_9AGAM|nr:hypothetical protein BJ138DRAFT_1008399 [Hygrophoropsis aurantiaca]